MGIVVVPSYGADPATVTGPNLDAKVDGLATEFNGNIDNDNIVAAAGIEYTKLDLTGKIVNADIVSVAFGKITGTIVADSFSPTAVPSDDTASGLTITLTAADDQNFGDVCYINSSGKAAIAKADAAATAYAFVMATATIAADASGTYMLMGVARDDSQWAWTVGGPIFLSATGTTGNTLTQTAPTAADSVTQIVGVATHADRMFFLPSLVQVVHV